MNNYPKYVEVNGRRYKINTDFRIAIRCNEIAEDETIGDFERVLGVLCTLFGEDSINHPEDYETLLKMAKKYLLCGQDDISIKEQKKDMDFVQDMDYIEASFMSDYNIDLTNTEMHWWKFFNLMNGLSNSELGNCCILNRIRNLRNYDISEIKDYKLKDKILKAKESVALKEKEKPLTKEQQQSVNDFYKSLGF